ncbi:MAG: MarC family protein [Bacteroidales bacterium]|jgi:multiple antibiotic resistance protein|nr:MarC family protein [Bacteroidales bacterium]
MYNFLDFIFSFNFQEFASVFIVLFSIIDITGATPIIIDITKRKGKINALNVSVLSLIIMVVFLFVGEAILRLFNVDDHSFAVAGALILFVLAIEMLLDIEIFKSNTAESSNAFVPIVFPLIAGAGVLTTLLSFRAEYQLINILLAILANLIIVYFVIRYIGVFSKFLGSNTVFILRKFFGVIIIAMAMKMLVSNLSKLL